MIRTTSTQTATKNVIRALKGSRPVIHLVTDDFEQVIAIMQTAYFGEEYRQTSTGMYSPGSRSERYINLRTFNREAGKTSAPGDRSSDGAPEPGRQKARPEKTWLQLAAGSGGKRVIYLSPDSEGELSGTDLSYLLDFVELKSLERHANAGEMANSCLVVYGRQLKLPSILEAHVARVELPPLCLEDFKRLLTQEYGIGGQGALAEWYMNQLAGFTEKEIRSILAEIAYGPDAALKISDKTAAERLIRKEKMLRLSRHGKLECIPAQDHGSGLQAVRAWISGHKENIRRTDFEDPEDITKGILLLGLPGSGKSMMAKCAAAILELPLIRLEMSRILGSLVGESEKNLDEVMEDLTTAGAPCVLWIDEVEKAFGGARKGAGDSGVTQRLFGKMLTFMQEMKRPIFIVATANDISSLPKEFTRPGRFSAIFCLMLPSYDECVDIMCQKLGRHFGYEDRNLARRLVDLCGGTETAPRFLTGADITMLAGEMCIGMKRPPGTGFAAGLGKADRESLHRQALAAMSEAAERCGVTADARVPKTLESVAESYCAVLEQSAQMAGSGRALICKDAYQPFKVNGVQPAMNPADAARMPLCLKVPDNFADLPAYDKRLLRWIGIHMDIILGRNAR